MSTHKRIDVICFAAVIFAIVLAALFMNGRTLGLIPGEAEGINSDMFTSNDLNAAWDAASATKITLSDEGSVISGNGAYLYDGDVYIVYAGHYVLSGALTNGSVIIDADKSDKIWVLLDDVAIHCEDGAALRVEQADKVFLTLADGTESVISSGAEYDEELAASGVDGVIYSRDDLTINGSGALRVDAAYYHGIVCNDDFVITGGDITISAVQDGIHANDSVRIREAEITISAGDDGITASNDDETAFAYIESGVITITDSYEGIEAIEVMIAGGTVDIVATDDGINANGSGVNSVIRITGGDITITNPSGRDGDGLDSNGSIYIEGGRVFISVSSSGGNYAQDYGSENGGECVVSGGTVIACGDSRMAEGFSEDSPQGFLMYTASAEAGTEIRLEDASGKELLSEVIPCSFSSVVLSTPELKVGDSCTIIVDGAEETLTIDNIASSGFGPAGMFGGGMRNGGDFGGMPGDTESRSGFGGRESGENGMAGRPDDMPAFEDMENVEFHGGMERPDSDMELPAGMEWPEGSAEPSGGTEPPDMERPEGMEPPGAEDATGSGDWQDRQGMRGGGFASGEDQAQRDGAPFQRQDGGQASLDGGAVSSGISADALVLLGASVLVLLLGLAAAVKVKH